MDNEMHVRESYTILTRAFTMVSSHSKLSRASRLSSHRHSHTLEYHTDASVPHHTTSRCIVACSHTDSCNAMKPAHHKMTRLSKKQINQRHVCTGSTTASRLVCKARYVVCRLMALEEGERWAWEISGEGVGLPDASMRVLRFRMCAFCSACGGMCYSVFCYYPNEDW
ncbi:hypothetical protein CC86DRAFT_209761 [Ophiobolus disseminans]|uniref:Uncharacterized protein n=1 Tax=Ophiobolus disseminans TaxID=1469910 RepID=A0A6A7A248_9PLEO|nr:hypothetical protein CC86DRAFT_209761 [Ophiobolus disseminans]